MIIFHIVRNFLNVYCAIRKTPDLQGRVSRKKSALHLGLILFLLSLVSPMIFLSRGTLMTTDILLMPKLLKQNKGLKRTSKILCISKSISI